MLSSAKRKLSASTSLSSSPPTSQLATVEPAATTLTDTTTLQQLQHQKPNNTNNNNNNNTNNNSGSITPPTPTNQNSDQDKRMKREIANSNERRRMQSINTGFQNLRQLLPHCDGDKLSKANILQQATELIQTIQQEKQTLHEQLTQVTQILISIKNGTPAQIALGSVDLNAILLKAAALAVSTNARAVPASENSPITLTSSFPTKPSSVVATTAAAAAATVPIGLTATTPTTTTTAKNLSSSNNNNCSSKNSNTNNENNATTNSPTTTNTTQQITQQHSQHTQHLHQHHHNHNNHRQQSSKIIKIEATIENREAPKMQPTNYPIPHTSCASTIISNSNSCGSQLPTQQCDIVTAPTADDQAQVSQDDVSGSAKAAIALPLEVPYSIETVITSAVMTEKQNLDTICQAIQQIEGNKF